MPIEHFDGGNRERRILIGMIVSDVVCGRIGSRWEKGGLFGARWSNIIGQWCVDHYERYSKAPNKGVEALFEEWAEENEKDKDTVELVTKFLEALSGEYASQKKAINAELILDEAGKHFNLVRVRRLKEDLETALEAGTTKKVMAKVAKFSPLELGMGEMIDAIRDDQAHDAALDSPRESIIKYPGAAGEFFGNYFRRDTFLAFLGGEKMGKSFYLFDVAYRAMLQGRKVVFFEVGDMSQSQILLRLDARIAKRPIEKTRPNEPVFYPISIATSEGDQNASVMFDKREYKEDLSKEECRIARHKLARKVAHTIQLACYPNSTISMNGIKQVLMRMKRLGETVDVVVIDYADILAPINGTADTRDQINATWKAMRALSMEFHCCVVTATQANAASYSASTIDRTHFSEDKRKFAHVTGMIGISATDPEQNSGVRRLNWIVLREGKYVSSHVLHCASCFPIANPIVHSCF